MNVELETTLPPILAMGFLVLSSVCFIVALGFRSAQQKSATDGDEPAVGRNGVVIIALTGMFACILLSLVSGFFYELNRMDPVEAAYEEQHGVTDMDAQTFRSSELAMLECLEYRGQGSVAYKWTDADGEKKSGLLEKDFAYQGKCEYTLTAIE